MTKLGSPDREVVAISCEPVFVSLFHYLKTSIVKAEVSDKSGFPTSMNVAVKVFYSKSEA